MSDWKTIMRGSRFKALPYDEKLIVADRYFEGKVANTERFLFLPSDQKRAVRDRFMKTLGPDPDPSGWTSFWNSAARNFPILGPDFKASMIDAMGYAEWKLGMGETLFERAEEIRKEAAFERPAGGMSGLVGGAATSALPTIGAVGTAQFFPVAGQAAAAAVLGTYAMMSAGSGARLVYNWEKETGEDISPADEALLIIGFGTATYLSERWGMKMIGRALSGASPKMMHSLGRSMISKNIPNAAKTWMAMAFPEGAEEGMEQLAQNALTKFIVNPEQGLTEHLGESILAGTAGGGFAATPLLSLRRMARNQLGLEEGEAPEHFTRPPKLKQLPILTPGTAEAGMQAYRRPRVPLLPPHTTTMQERTDTGREKDMALAREAHLRWNVPEAAEKLDEAKRWQRIWKTAAGHDPESFTHPETVDPVNLLQIEQGRTPAKPDGSVEETEVEGTNTSEKVQVAVDARNQAIRKLAGVRKGGRKGTKTQAVLEEAEAEVVEAWNEVNEDPDGEKLRDHLAAESVDTKYQQTEKAKEPRARRIKQGVSGKDLAVRTEAERDLTNAQEKLAAIEEPTPDDLADIEDEYGVDEIYEEAEEEKVHEDEGDLIDEENLLFQANTESKKTPSLIERQRLVRALQTSGIVKRVIQTPGQLYDFEGQPINAVLDRETGTVYLSADVDFATLGHEAFHRLVDELGTDHEVIGQLLASYNGDVEKAADDFGKFFRDQALEPAVSKRLGNWLSDMWLAVKTDAGLPVARERLLQAANIHAKSIPNGRGQKGWWFSHKAYHGSGAEFDQFLASKVGSGEGAQAFGWGIYFTDEESIARDYATKLGRPAPASGVYMMRLGKEVFAVPRADASGKDVGDDVMAELAGSWTKLKAHLTGLYERRLQSEAFKPYWRRNEARLAAVKKGDFEIIDVKSSRRVYTVTLHKGKKPEDYEYLDWHEPVPASQRKKIAAAVKDYVADRAGEETGMFSGQVDWVEEVLGSKEYPIDPASHMYEVLSTRLRMSRRDASLFLLDAGIDGIRYPTGTLSGKGKKGRKEFNYVIFDPEAATIESRYSFQKAQPEDFVKNINLNRMDLEEADRELMKQEFSSARDPDKLSDEELTKQAEAMIRRRGQEGMARLARAFRSGKKGVTVVEHAALRIYAGSNFLQHLHMGLNQTDMDLGTFFRMMADQEFELASKLSYDAGRKLEFHRHVFNPLSLQASFARLEKMVDEDFRAALKQAIEDGSIWDPVVAARLGRQLEEPRVQDYFWEFYYLNLLSSPTTHLVNAANNALWLGFQLPDRVVESAVDATLSSSMMQVVFPSLRGRSRQVFLAEVVPMWMGVHKRANKVLRYLVKNRGLDPETFDGDITKWAVDMGPSMQAWRRSPHRWMRAAAPYVEFPSQALVGMDVFFKSMAYDAQMNALAVRESKKTGRIVADVLANPSQEMMADAANFAKYATFMDRGRVNDAIMRLRDVAPWGTGRLILPFVNTMTNILKRGVEMTPGVGIAAMEPGRKEGKTRGTEVIARQVEGAILALILASVFDDDEDGEPRITGAAPQDPARRDAFYRSGKIPWAVRIGDTWISYRRAEPFALPLAMTATVVNEAHADVDEDHLTDVFGRFAHAIGRTVITNSYLDGVARLAKEQGISRYVERIPSNLVPYSSFWRSLNRAADVMRSDDPEAGARLRESRGILAQLGQTLPFMEEEGPFKARVRLNSFGEEIKIPGGAFRQWLPFKWSRAALDPVETELERLGRYPGLPSQTFKHGEDEIELDDDFYREYVQLYGKETKQMIVKAMAGPRYRALSDPAKERLINRAVSRGQTVARRKMKAAWFRLHPRGTPTP